MLKREIKRIKNRFSGLFDPLGIVALVALFLLPALAIINLSPIATSEQRNVLGVGDGEGVSAVLVGGVHDIIKEEIITFPNDQQIAYQAKLIARDAGTYSKPVLQLVNYDGAESTVRISGSTELGANTEVSVIVNDQRYIIESRSGEQFIQEIALPASSKSDLYLNLDSDNNVRFNDMITLRIVAQ